MTRMVSGVCPSLILPMNLIHVFGCKALTVTLGGSESAVSGTHHQLLEASEKLLTEAAMAMRGS
jgi:hypothetical protein